ncbi:hypothetical protein ACEPAI_9114 [Sanghuangporus weigelae]
MPPRTRTSDKYVLPRDYTFAPSGIPIHKASYERVLKLLDQANKRDPDRFDLYIYNDYFGDAVLDLVDSTLSTVYTHVTKKRWQDAWHTLDALAKFNQICGAWINVDDGERVAITETAHGALIVTTIRALDAAGQLNKSFFPDLAYTLRDMAQWTLTWWDTLDTYYHRVLKGYGKKLLGGRTDEEYKREASAVKKAYNAFVQKLSPEEREKGRYKFIGQKDEQEENRGDAEEGGRRMWYEDGDVRDISLMDSSFSVFSTWKKYKECLRESPQVPLYGPPEWDLTQWTEAEKREFKLGNKSRWDLD